MGGVDRESPTGAPLEPRERASAAATCVLHLLRDLLELARDLDRLAGHEQEPRRAHLETAPAGIVAEGARDLIGLGLPLEVRLLLVPADRVPVHCVLQRLQLGLESVHAPTEVGDGVVIARTPTAEPSQHGGTYASGWTFTACGPLSLA